MLSPCCLLLLALAMAGCQQDQSLVGWALSPFKSETPREAVAAAVNAYDPDARARGITTLAGASFGGEEPYRRLYAFHISEDPDRSVRAAAAHALAIHGRPKDAEVLVAGLSDESEFVRWEAAKALQRIHAPSRDTIDALRNAVQMPLDPVISTSSEEKDGELNADVRMAAAHALGQYADPGVFDSLVGALNDQDYGVVAAALRSLRLLTGKDFGTDARVWVKWRDANPGKLFEEQRPYTWIAYQRSPGWLDSLFFWEAAPDPHRPPRRAENGNAPSDKPADS